VPHQHLRRQHGKAEALAPAQTAAQLLRLTKRPHLARHLRTWLLLNVPLHTTVKSLVLATDTLNDKGEVVKSTMWLALARRST
jgi:prolyl-tRNA synthetase